MTLFLRLCLLRVNEFVSLTVPNRFSCAYIIYIPVLNAPNFSLDDNPDDVKDVNSIFSLFYL